jgi:hypothetical protein
VQGIRPADTPKYFRMGKVFHAGLDLKSKGMSKYQAIESALSYYDIESEKDDNLREKLSIEREVAARLLNGYFWRWQEMDQQTEVIASEIPFELEIINPVDGSGHPAFVIAGRIDKIIKLPDGRLAVMEHKTTSEDIEPASKYWKKLRIDIQISIYFHAARKLGYNVDTVLYDVIRKPGYAKPKQLTQAQTNELISTSCYHAKFNNDKDYTFIGRYEVVPAPLGTDFILVNGQKAPITHHKKGISIAETIEMYGDRISADMARRYDYYFARREIPRLESDMADTDLCLWQYANMIYDNYQLNRWPCNDDACIGFGTCCYLDICSGYFDLNSGNVPEGFMKVHDVHQELIDE